MMNVVVLSNLYPNPDSRDRGVFTFQIVKHLQSLCDVRVVCPLPYFPRWKMLRRFRKWAVFSSVPSRYEYEGTAVFSPKYPMLPKVSESVHASLMCIPVLYCLRKLNEDKRIDLVNVHYLYPDAVAAVWACRILGLPVVVTALGSDVHYYSELPWIGSLIKTAVKRADVATAVSEELSMRIRRWGIDGRKVVTVPNGVDLSLFAVKDKVSCRQKLALPEDCHIILFIGRLSREKGFDLLIKSISGLKRTSAPNFRVVVVGDGPERKALEKEIADEGLGELFDFRGVQDHSTVSDWLGGADLLCLPSLREGSPNVVLESLASGRPVVASRVGGIPYMVEEDRNGMMFSAGDVQNLSEKLRSALTRDWDPLTIRDSVSSKSWHAIVGQYCDLFSDVVKSRGKAR